MLGLVANVMIETYFVVLLLCFVLCVQCTMCMLYMSLFWIMHQMENENYSACDGKKRKRDVVERRWKVEKKKEVSVGGYAETTRLEEKGIVRH